MYLRHPKGFVNAKRHDLKSTKCPPTNYDDIPIKMVDQWRTYTSQMRCRSTNFSIFWDKIKLKFPRIPEWIARDLYYNERNWESEDWNNWGSSKFVTKQVSVFKKKKKF